MTHFIVLQPNDGGYTPLGRQASSVSGAKQTARLRGWNRTPLQTVAFSYYNGRRYQIIEKRERDIFIQEERSFGEYSKRCFLGLIVVVCSLGIALLIGAVRELFSRQETIRRKETAFVCKFSPSSSMNSPSNRIDKPIVLPEPNRKKKSNGKKEYEISKVELEKGIELSANTISKVQNCMQDILQRSGDEITFYNSQDCHRVFTLNSTPGIIFKIDTNSNDSMRNRFDKMIKAKTVVRINNLGKLVIPNAKLFTVTHKNRQYDVIAEQKLDLDATDSVQEGEYKRAGKAINEAVAQLTLFICKTFFRDVEWRNIPILNGDTIALIDLEEMGDSPEVGLFGLHGRTTRRGLVNCVNREQGKIIERVARENNVSTSSFSSSWNRRDEELRLDSFYKKNNIVTGQEPIQVDLVNLKLFDAEDITFNKEDSFENRKRKEMEIKKQFAELTTILINEINQRLKRKYLDPIKDHRNLRINVTGSEWGTNACNRMGSWPGLDLKSIKGQEYALSVILGELKKMGTIHSYSRGRWEGMEYIVQV